MTNSLVQHLTNKLGQTHFWFTEPSEKHTSVTLKLFKHDEVAKLTSLPFILGHVVSLFPDLFFLRLRLTLPRCLSISLIENVVRMCQEWRRGRKKKRKKESVIMTSVCFTHLNKYTIWHTSLSVGDDTVWQWFNSSTVRKYRIAIRPTLALCCCFLCFPWWHLTIQYFTLSLAIETCGELCAMVHRQSRTDTQCCLKGCSVFTAGTLLHCLVTVSLRCQLGRNG